MHVRRCRTICLLSGATSRRAGSEFVGRRDRDSCRDRVHGRWPEMWGTYTRYYALGRNCGNQSWASPSHKELSRNGRVAHPLLFLESTTKKGCPTLTFFCKGGNHGPMCRTRFAVEDLGLCRPPFRKHRERMGHPLWWQIRQNHKVGPPARRAGQANGSYSCGYTRNCSSLPSG